ncbi:MAG TPA: peptidylprolyl isomerase [Orrella sp.]
MKRFAMLIAAATLAAPIYAQNIATVNGQPITQEAYEQFVELLGTQGAPDSPELREQVKEEMINRLVMVQAAEKAGITNNPEVKTELELARQGILVRALMADYLEKNPVTEEKVRAEYDKLQQEQGEVLEYNVRHILVEDEATANDLQKQLNDKSASFEELAKAQSKDPGSAAQGGSLGWASADNYVAPFAQAVQNTPKGQMTDKPVQTQFGWHVIEVVDARPIAFPPFEEVRTQLEEMMRQQELMQFQQKLRSEAKID